MYKKLGRRRVDVLKGRKDTSSFGRIMRVHEVLACGGGAIADALVLSGKVQVVKHTIIKVSEQGINPTQNLGRRTNILSACSLDADIRYKGFTKSNEPSFDLMESHRTAPEDGRSDGRVVD